MNVLLGWFYCLGKRTFTIIGLAAQQGRTAAMSVEHDCYNCYNRSHRIDSLVILALSHSSFGSDSLRSTHWHSTGNRKRRSVGWIVVVWGRLHFISSIGNSTQFSLCTFKILTPNQSPLPKENWSEGLYNGSAWRHPWHSMKNTVGNILVCDSL